MLIFMCRMCTIEKQSICEGCLVCTMLLGQKGGEPDEKR